MRLRLSVQRNNLPATNVLWTVPDTNSSQAYTIVRLLEDVNKVLPLEAQQWGLEDYIVEVDSFECLHFAPVAQLLKEDDHVSIRPLLTAEVRSRTLCGRHQISEDGRHLIDGIPFGRPYLRQPLRPSVRIPPRKRQRLDVDVEREEDEDENLEMMGMITTGESTPLNGSVSPEFVNDTSGTQQLDKSRKAKRKRKLTFVVGDEKDQEMDAEESSDSEDDEDFAPSEGSRSDDSGESNDSSDASSDSFQDSTSGSDSDSDSESESSDDSGSLTSAPEVRTSKAPNPLVPPFHGSKNTKRRNLRRREAQKLRRMKAVGLFHPEATLADLRAEQSTPSSVNGHAPAHPMSKATGKRKYFVEEDAEGGLDENNELERRRQQLMADLELDTAPSSSSGTATLDKNPVLEPVEKPTTATVSIERPAEPDLPPPRKRLLPNTNAIRRILLHQTNNDKKKSRKQLPSDTTPEPEGVPDPDFWKSKINLSAFECWDEEFELSTPPFPFKQHWDPASKLMREKASNKKAKKKGKRMEEIAVNNDETETPILDYGDSPDPSRSKQDFDTTAAIENQLMQDAETATKSDLPPVPDDVAALPALESKDVLPGAIIIFKEFVINPETVTPEISAYKTGVVEKEGDSGAGAGTFRLRLAARDVPKVKSVLPNGKIANTARDAFRMVDEEEQDEQLWEGTFSELLEPKLLVPVEG